MKNEAVHRLRSWIAWGGALLGIALIGLFSANPSVGDNRGDTPGEEMTLFGGGLENGWQDWSWAEHQIPDPQVKLEGKPTIRFVAAQYKGLYLHHEAFSTHGYEALSFSIRGGGTGGQKISVCFVDENRKFGPMTPLSAYLARKSLPAGQFVPCVIPLSALKAKDSTITGFCLQDASGGTQPPVYVAALRLTAPRRVAEAGPVTLTVHADQELGPISPYIYGMAQPTPEHISQLRLKLARWGGNPASRYNWVKGNCWNAAADWEFRNGNYGSTSPTDRQPSGVADKAIAANKATGVDTILTIPTLGWVARDDNNATASTGVPATGGPPIAPGSDAIAGYDPTENRQRVSQRSLPRKGRPFSDPPDTHADVVYQDEWVYHLTRKFGRANTGGVRFYAMDNEPDLWSGTHRDMHPVRPDYDELLKQFLDYGTAVKDVDPTAQVTGPVSWGWTGYMFSPRDQGSDNYATAADRKAHGDMPFLAWFLQQAAAHDKRTGKRTLDVLDVHFYPQGSGVYGGATDALTNQLRLRSTRALWDTAYKDESWIGTEVMLIPRLRQWISQYYPGTKIGLTEWNWGADNTLNGGLAVAEILGILGRQRVDLACYWTAPGVGTPGFYAWKMYRNADGVGHGFGDMETAADSSDAKNISCFGSIDSKTGQPIVMIINKMPKDSPLAAVRIQSKKMLSSAEVYRYSGTDLKSIAHLPNINITAGKASLVLPPYSITLLRCH